MRSPQGGTHFGTAEPKPPEQARYGSVKPGRVMTGGSPMRSPLLATAVLALSLLAGCQKGPPAAHSVDAADKALVNGATPSGKALASAIQVDPARAHGYTRQGED